MLRSAVGQPHVPLQLEWVKQMADHAMSAKAYSVADEVAGQAKAVAAKATEQAQTAAKQVGELGSEALDEIDVWLKPIGLSLKAHPAVTLAVLGGAAAIAGALWMSRRSAHNW